MVILLQALSLSQTSLYIEKKGKKASENVEPKSFSIYIKTALFLHWSFREV